MPPFHLRDVGFAEGPGEGEELSAIAEEATSRASTGANEALAMPIFLRKERRPTDDTE
jgi:hypothetical protein